MKKFETYEEVCDFLMLKLPMFTRQGPAALKPSLKKKKKLLESMGNPHQKYKIVHVAGTNGKGSVSHLLAGMLASQGYKVGLHTSPHYKDMRERMKVNGKLPEKDFVINFTNQWLPLIESLQPSFFEITVAMSFEYFAREQVDFAVIEVGLGGRLDSTNVVDPLLSVITNISLDHTELLGNTLEAIAGEKAGIIKKGKPVLIGERQEETTPVFNNIAIEHSSPLTYAEDICEIIIHFQDFQKTMFSVRIPGHQWKMEIDISGPFQDKNLRTAFAGLSLLEQEGMKWNLSKLKKYLKSFRSNVYYLGRWQVLDQCPMVLVDSAHNEGGMAYILAALKNHHQGRLHMVIGFAADKKREVIFNALPKNATYYFSKANIPRALDPQKLKEEAAEYNLYGNAYASVIEAYSAARQAAEDDDIIFVGGSIFVVAELV